MPPSCDENFESDPQTFWSTYVLPRVAHIEGITSRNNAGSKAHAQRMLDNELSAMHLAMCSLRTRRNALSPISALPAETLVHIFEFYAAIQPPGPHDLGWIEVTHVCRFWRDSALQTSGLWNNITFSLGSQWAETMLSRAKAVPLILCQDVSEASQSSLDLIPKCVLHACELSLVGPVSVLRSIIDNPLCLSETLKTIELQTVNANLRILAIADYELPEAIFKRRLPSLRRLALRSFWVPWSAPILCGLTHLEIQLHRSLRPENNEYLTSSHEKILCALKNMPGLETLILQHCFPYGHWRGGGDDLLQLPRLNVLQLQGQSAACFGLTKRLHIPPSCQVQLRCNNPGPTTDIPEIIPFLTTHTSANAGLPPWRKLSITTAFDHHRSLQMWSEYNSIGPLEISFYDSEPFGPLKALCQALPLETISSVRLHISLDPEVQDWIDILGRCTKVEEVSISTDHDPMPSFFTALNMTTDCKPLPELETCEDNHLFLGKLMYLTLSGVDFSTEDSTDTSQLQLIRSLTERQRVTPTSKRYIRILDCSIKKEWVEDLRNVALVDWDEDEGGCWVSSEEEQVDSEEDDSDEDEW